MDKETARYIKNYFSRLMTDDERLALKYHMYTYKTEDNPAMRKLASDRGWISERPEIREFLKGGYEEFELNLARRILKEMPEKVFLNNCPKCYKLARTPFARQCRYCGHNWHDLTVAQFKLERSVQQAGGPFFLLGRITKGEAAPGQFVDLTMLGLSQRPVIEVIESEFSRQDGKSYEGVGLGTNELTEEDKTYIINVGSFGTPFDIIKAR